MVYFLTQQDKENSNLCPTLMAEVDEITAVPKWNVPLKKMCLYLSSFPIKSQTDDEMYQMVHRQEEKE